VNILLRLFPAAHFVVSVMFMLAGVGLIILAGYQLWEGLAPLEGAGRLARLHAVLESIAVLTVAVAALELGQTILEEEVHREAQMSAPTRVRRFLSRFMVVLVVALSIETLVLVFRFSRDTPEQLPYAASVGAAAALLLVAWGLFIRFNVAAEQLEPEAMQAAKREDRKIEKSAKGEEKS
jgi:hypothetical protein